MEADPLFQHEPESHTLDQFRRITAARVRRIRDYNLLNDELAVADPRKVHTSFF